MSKRLTALLERRTALLAELDNENTTEERLAEIDAEAAEVRAAIEAENSRIEQRNALAGLIPAQTVAGSVEARVAPGRTEPRSTGQLLTESAEFRAMTERGGATMDSGVEVRDILGLDATLSPNGAGTLARPDNRGFIAGIDLPRVSQLLQQGTTTSGSIEYFIETTVNGAGPAAETAEGGLKPEADINFSQDQTPVRTIPVYVPITKQALADVPQLRSIVDNRLRTMVEQRLDSQVIGGDGVGVNLRGLWNTPGAIAYTAPLNEAAVISLRKARTAASPSGLEANIAAMTAAAWQRIELSTDADGAFRVTSDPTSALPPRIWGMLVALTPKLADASVLVTNRQAATVWLRETTNVTVGYVNDQFIRNTLTVLAELRAAVTVERPAAVVKVTLDGAGL